jgi:rubrerythrin
VREHQRRREGKCTACGYDMTGLEFNERCPECGAQVW